MLQFHKINKKGLGMDENNLEKFKAFDGFMREYKSDILKQDANVDEESLRILEGIEVKVKELKAIMFLVKKKK